MVKTDRDADLPNLCSKTPWRVSLVVERIGPDLLCRVHGGTEHVGAVTLGHWEGGRARVEELVVGRHKEGPLARIVAHRLCRASQSTVVCIAGIHYDNIDSRQIEEISQQVQALSVRAASQLEDMRITQALTASGAMFERIRKLATPLNQNCEEFLDRDSEAIIEDARAAALSEHTGDTGRSVVLFAPLYLSNACPNDCAYCGFRRSASFERTRLSIEEALREAHYLAEAGFRTIDLVAGEIATDTFVVYASEIVEQVRAQTPIQCVNLNLGALSQRQFQRLRSAGATGYHLYQETYDPAVYAVVHRRGRKRDMAGRLEASRWAVEGGFRSIGLGVLLGLSDPAQDLAHLAAHAKALTEIQPDLAVGFSLPRIQPVDGACNYTPKFDISDELFTTCVLFLRKRFPRASVTLTTREAPALRNRLLPLGISKISAEVATSPGGYAARRDRETEQFGISDRRSLTELTRVIADLGLEPVFDS